MKPHGGHGVGSKHRRRETEKHGEVPCHPLAGIPLDGPVPEDQREREHQERSKLQGEQCRPEQHEEACGKGPNHQRAPRIVIRAVLGEGHGEACDEFLSDGASVELFTEIGEQIAWIQQNEVQETARDEEQKESAERYSQVKRVL